MDIGWEDTLPWGQYKGKKIADIAKTDVPYLAWLRDARAKGNSDKGYGPQQKFFARPVLEFINEQIAADVNRKKGLRGKFVEWDLETLFAAPVPASAAPKKEEILEQIKMQETYDTKWGAF